MVKIALRYITHRSPDANFTKFLSALKRYFNNNKNITAGRFPNEIIYDTNLNEFFEIISLEETRDLE